MAKPTKIKHPLLHRPGSSQRKRYAEALALQPDAALLDERTLADQLDFVYRYARQINFYDYQQHPLTQEAYQEVRNWSRFLENSLPIHLARLSKISVEALKLQYSKLIPPEGQSASNESLQLLLQFGYQEIILPVVHLWEAMEPYDEFGLRPIIENNIVSAFSHSVRDFIQLHNAALQCDGIQRRSYQAFINHPWNISPAELFSVARPPGETTPNVTRITGDVAKVLANMLPSLQHIVRQAPDFIMQSLQVYQGRHEPHLGLLFTFLQLFNHVKNDLNKITKKHLDFFYQDVLRFEPKALVPDKAHLVFEIAQHLKQYPLKEGLLFKDGKDAKNADIIFGLDDEIVIDKAKVEKLQTLHLHPVEGKVAGSETTTFVEGAYIAPVANSADGKGEAFKETQSKNWVTLGAKPSKYTPPGGITPQNHPYGRIGFVLASPVLWLNEGEREIRITLTCDASANQDVLTDCFKKLKNPFDEKYYSLTDNTIQKLLPLKRENGTPLLRDQTLAYLNTLLVQQNPYPIGYEHALDAFLNVQDQVKCEPRFDEFETVPVCEALEYREFKKCFSAIEDIKKLPLIQELSQVAKNRLQQVINLPGNINLPKYKFLDINKIFNNINYTQQVKQNNEEKLAPEDEAIIKKSDAANQLHGGSIFKIALTGKDGWYEPPCIITEIAVDTSSKEVTFDIRVKLEPSESPIIFYDPQKHKEPYDLKQVLPLIKVEVDPDIKVNCPNTNAIPPCDLAGKSSNETLSIALYHFFRHLTILEAKIEVEVCGVKNVVVQNDENVQDVNKLILPFGVRPKLGANFYIGSKEIFCKDWQQVWVNVAWKDRPTDFGNHYKKEAYYYDIPFEDGSQEINNNSFKATVALLKEGQWWQGGKMNVSSCDTDSNTKKTLLFVDYSPASFCELPQIRPTHQNSYQFYKKCFADNEYTRKKIDPSPLAALTIAEQDAFLRLTLDGVSFQHHRYPFVLARQMFALSGTIDPIKKGAAIDNFKVAMQLTKPILDKIDELKKVNENNKLLDKLLQQIIEIEDIIKRSSGSPDRKKHGIRQLLNELGATTEGSVGISKNKIKAITLALDNLKLTGNNSILEQITKRLDTIKSDINSLLAPASIQQTLEETLFFDGDNEANTVNRTTDGLKQLFEDLEKTLGAENDEPLTAADLENARSFLNDIDELRIEIHKRIKTLQDNTDATRNKTESIQRNVSRDKDANQNTLNVLEDGAIQLFDALKKIIEDLTSNSTIITNSLDLWDQVGQITAALSWNVEEIFNKNKASSSIIEKAVEVILGKPATDENGNPVARPQVIDDADKPIFDTNGAPIYDSGLRNLFAILNDKLNSVRSILSPTSVQIAESGLANEPYTPTIQGFSLDYTAQALITDIDLLHLYPFENTSKTEDITLQPTLLPTFTDDGTLFIGLKELRPGANLHLLFQLAEATADSERTRARLHWHYLTGNRWQPLRTGFEVLADGTDGLTVSGIVKIAVPGDISERGNTVMPAGLFWIKVATPDHVEAVAEVIGVHAQAAEVTFQAKPTNDSARLAKPLPAGQISKLVAADFSVKKIEQPYESFGGKQEEASGHFYTRISEHLRHKGRGIAPFDHERLLLEAFPTIFKAKCVSHTFGLSARQYRRDLEVAPGFVVVAVIPDLTKLKAGNMLEPRAPVSLLEDIKDFLQKRMSPFARLQVMNPRYEKIQVDVTVTLLPGKDRVFYTNQLQEDLSRFFAPWYLGDSDKITFGQSIVHSDVVKFIENLDYVDFIKALKLKDLDGEEQTTVAPQTARSILTSGEICVTIEENCAKTNSNQPADAPKKTPFRFGAQPKRPLVDEKQP